MTYCSTFGPKVVKLEGSWHREEPPLLPGLAKQRGSFGQHQGSPLSRDLQMLEGCPVAKPPWGAGGPLCMGAGSSPQNYGHGQPCMPGPTLATA